MGLVNRSEKEALDNVCVIASPAGSLKQVVDAIDTAIANVTSIMNSGDLELPDDMVESMNDGLRSFNEFKDTYQEKAKELSESNRRLSEDIQRRMSNSQKSATDTKGHVEQGKAAAAEIKGGVK